MASGVFRTEQDAHPVPQVLCVGEKDSKKLLEVYVRRSLSLNDGSQCPPWREHRTSKWHPISQQNKKERKHSSDTSLHLRSTDLLEYIDDDDAFSEPQPVGNSQASSEPSVNKSTVVKEVTLNRNDSSSASHSSVGKSTGKTKKWLLHFEKDKKDNAQLKENSKSESEHITYENVSVLPQPDQLDSLTEKKPKEKKKKPSIWKSFLEWFTKGHNDKQEDHVGDDERTEEAISSQEPPTPQPSCLPFPSDVNLRQNKASKKGRAHRRFSLKRRSGDMGADKSAGRPSTLDLNADAQKVVVQSITEVEPTCLYYEKVSEELQKIVYEVQHSPIDENRRFTDSVQSTDISDIPLSKEEVITRIFDLIKQKGDDMDCKLKENPAISSYFSTLSYGAFKQLADQYVKSEVSHQTVQPPVAAPELVKFAFTLDFTARVAGLSRHTPGHIVGFGNQYLKDRFTYMSEKNPHFSDIKEGGNTSKDHLDKGET